MRTSTIRRYTSPTTFESDRARRRREDAEEAQREEARVERGRRVDAVKAEYLRRQETAWQGPAAQAKTLERLDRIDAAPGKRGARADAAKAAYLKAQSEAWRGGGS